LLSFQTWAPPTVIVYVLVRPRPVTQIGDHTVPLTVAPGLGVVIATVSVPPPLPR